MNLIVNDLSPFYKLIESGNLWAILICACVFITYHLIVKTYDTIKAKEKNKPIIEMGNSIREMNTNLVNLNIIVSKFIQDSSKKDIEKCKNTIKLAFTSFESTVFNACRDIIINNNIEANKELIISNIHQIINSEYYNISSCLSLYEFNNKNVSSKLKERWIEDIGKDVVSIIYNNQGAKERISSIKNRLNAKISDYSVYVYNKTFND